MGEAGQEEISRAAEAIRLGKLVAFPTETVYGLGANALDSAAVCRIYEAKGRPWASPLIVHVADENMARTITAEWPAIAGRLSARFWPGPLTLVLRKAAIVPDVVTAGLDTVGVRIPDHPVALELIRRAGTPIAAPSANRFTEVSPTSAEHVRTTLGAAVDVILDGGASQVGIESTVVTLARTVPVILRPGMIPQSELEQAAGEKFEREMDVPHIVTSPGQHARHYAPRTRFYVLAAGVPAPEGSGKILEMPGDFKPFAAQLYERLRTADAEGWEWIAVRKPPETESWMGILDRLKRASAPAESFRGALELGKTGLI